ncbi:MAG: 4Fe-4S dicluster domain-containing protein [Thermodesulfobacteriota bacterium]
MKFRLDKKDFRSFLQNLIETVELFAPVRLAEGVSVYRKIDYPEEVDLTHPNPQKPAKDLFFPQSEVMFRYEKSGKQMSLIPAEEVKQERVLLGARPCDIEGISIIEKVFEGKEYADIYFLEKRKKTTIIGLGCNVPLSTCFCSSTGGGPFLRQGSDVFLIDLGDSYWVELLSEKGMALQKNPLLKEADKKDLIRAKALQEKALAKVDASVPIDGIDKRLDLMTESPFWDRAHEPCIGCRICTYLCPTCHCFDIVDEGDSKKGQRVRNWDSCLSPLYSLETSGHNPRPTSRERTRQRLMHKFNYYPKTFGRVACVGCGRCIVYCPIHFDIRKAILWTSPERPKIY